MKTISLKQIDCPSCAYKMEKKIRKIKGVRSADINVIAERLYLDADEENYDEIYKQVVNTCKRIDANCLLEVE